MSMQPRNEKGQYVAVNCPDLNCSGQLSYQPTQHYHAWACDGLTHKKKNDDLEACDRFVCGPNK